MLPLKRIRYYSMNLWNCSTAPAYNLKVYNVINKDLRDKVYQLMDSDQFYEDINLLMYDFAQQLDHEWQAGFNGRSGGYLVLYMGGKKKNGQVFSYPGKDIDDNEIPSEVLKAFRQLAIDIVKTTEYKARHCQIKEEEYTVIKIRKVIINKEDK